MTVLGHGTEIVTSSTRPSSAVKGTMIYETDTNKILRNISTTLNSPSWVEINNLNSADGLSATGQTKLDNRGLVYINSWALSGASVTLTNCFSTDYQNYHMIGWQSTSNSSSCNLMLGTSGGAYTNSWYTGSYLGPSPAGAAASYASTSNVANANYGTGSWVDIFVTDFTGPYLSQPTMITGTYSNYSNGNRAIYVHGGYDANATSYVSLKLTPNGGGTFSTGYVRMYGYKD